MKNYLISYDLHLPHQNYSALIEVIKSAPYWIKINQSVWYIKSPLNSIEIKNTLVQFADIDDVIFVAEMQECAWSDSLDANVKNYIATNWHQ